MQWFHMLHVCSSSVIDFPQKLSHKIKLPISNTIVAHLHVTSFQLYYSTLPFKQADKSLTRRLSGLTSICFNERCSTVL